MVEILWMKVTQTFSFFCAFSMHGNEKFISVIKRDRQSSLPGNISMSTIDVVNKEVKIIASVQSDDVSKTQGNYIKLTAKYRATIGKYAAKNGIAAAILEHN